ncbi:hypothetical protein ACFYYR_26935 [Streptomyces sp. NPDC001922]|uniref:hypothetical protein n=1 Tax=Streptomyces sp. NPDC001922 TaxID=3364624 RepID=UPI0036ADCC3A
MSRARRTNKSRVLGIGLASAGLITGVVATGAAMAGEGDESSAAAKKPVKSTSCLSAGAPSSGVVATAQKGGSVDLSRLDGQLAGLLAAAGAEADSLQSLDDALRAVPSRDAGVVIDGVKIGGDKAPTVRVKSLDERDPEAWAKANPKTDLGRMNAQLAAVNRSLADIWSQTGGLENLQAAFGQIAINSNINIDDIDIDDIELDLKKADADQVKVRMKSAGCGAGQAARE